MNRPYISFLFSLTFFLSLRIAWIIYTGHTFEDAFITFRFAQNIAGGHGFVHNIGEPIYGTTTPLFTFLLAAWVSIFPGTIIIGAWVYDLLASTLMVVFLCAALKHMDLPREQRVITVLALAVPAFLIRYETEGMEMPLVLCFMALSFYGLVLKHELITGMAIGLLLWTRIDGVFWGAFIFLALWISTRKFPIGSIIVAGIVYLPWVLFAYFYFGSAIPYTIIAKALNYGKLPFIDALRVGFGIVGPLLILVLLGLFVNSNKAWVFLFAGFFAVDMVRLAALNETFEARYFVPLFWAGTIVLGAGLHKVYEVAPQIIGLGVLAIFITISLFFAVPAAQDRQHYQQYVYSTSLQGMGEWLNKNSPQGSTVLLEPLGYVGFYADRHMLDEVGLITPRMIEVRSVNRNIWYAIKVLNPDYTIQHCDYPPGDSLGFFQRYKSVFVTNPLNFNPVGPAVERTIRNSCYVIWERITP